MPASILIHKRTPLKSINVNCLDNSTPEMNFLFHSSRTLNSIVDSGQENIGWVCCPDVRARITKIQEDTHVLMGTNKRTQERTSYIKNVINKIFQKEAIVIIFFPPTDIIQLPLLPVIHIHIHTHTIKKN